jgi:hypothetical protein
MLTSADGKPGALTSLIEAIMSSQVAITQSEVIATCEQSRKEMLIAPFVHPRGTDGPKAFKNDASIT